jgi:hypothetical protein
MVDAFNNCNHEDLDQKRDGDEEGGEARFPEPETSAGRGEVKPR